MKWVIASSNGHKVKEFRTILQEELKSLWSRFEFLSLRDFAGYLSPEETGATFGENALIKARQAAQILGQWAIADDSGLVVPALGGAPGVYSARYAGSNATDKENRLKLLQVMHSFTGEARSAYFECCIAIAGPQGQEKVFRGLCEGFLLSEERGNLGFGYDALFVKHDYSKTFAELDATTKNRISHRRKALDRAAIFLQSLISQ